jgi:hypothetical protein
LLSTKKNQNPKSKKEKFIILVKIEKGREGREKRTCRRARHGNLLNYYLFIFVEGERNR